MVSLIILSVLASIMVMAIIATLIFAINGRSYTRVFFVYFILGMMMLMLVGAVLYLLSPSQESLEIAFGINMIYMIIVLAYYFMIAEDISNRVINNLKLHSVALGILVVINEILMGTTFTLAQYGRGLFTTVLSSVYYSVNSLWFFYPMMVEMLGLYLYHFIRGDIFKNLFALIGVATFPPTIFSFYEWVYTSIGFSVIFSIIGILNSDKTWKIIYGLLALTTLLVFISPYPYDAMIIISMIFYYSKTITLGAKTIS
ncbi:hypothetical protein [Sulfurisphaera ohwakuensis]|uniref:Uncharacterized protein n=1 Tax=Sulfurisphaera ohwakuensis TaxID=69656 RepID=A0A650CKD9_SULOH|nr:hypothetical protein [Sulfurisphaera ohwakuensis]MBB5254286.1 hypothetical protein [Sulfurisphaera ohwakuensis]QGR18183.1 hypothetical protein D1869_14035 [Sulfurisphaera ohwakuensis]